LTRRTVGSERLSFAHPTHEQLAIHHLPSLTESTQPSLMMRDGA
jgi:hypothetical protein